MIRYYAYYSFGGYKDMLLGNSEMNDIKEVFYSPFYEQWRKNGGLSSISQRMEKQMKELDKKQHIIILTKENSSQIPSDALTFVTYSGFELVCCRLHGGQTTVAIKDLKGGLKDEYGRETPFMLQLIGDDEEQILLLCEYVRQNWQDAVNFLSGLFGYNVELNALQFNIERMNEWVAKVLDNPVVAVGVPEYCRLPVVVISDGVSVNYLAKEIGLSKADFGIVYNFNGRIVYENTYSRTDNMETCSYSGNSCNFSVDNLMTHIKTFLSVTPDDKEDYEQIRQHISNIINRRIHRK